MISFNNIVDTFQTFVDNHFFLKTFGYGSQEDVDQEKNTDFPLLHLVYTQGSYQDGLKNYALDIYILDLPNDKEDKVSFQKEAISDSEKCAEDIINDITNGFNIFTWASGTTVQSASITPLEEETKNTLAGVLLSISIDVPYVYNACDLPLIPVTPSAPSDCLPATYVNGDSSFTIEIVSGSTYTAPNITVTQADGTTSSVVPNINLTCTFPVLELVNTVGTSLEDITSYPTGGEIVVVDTPVTNSDASFTANAPSGATYTAPDIDVTQVNGTTASVPSLQDIVCAWNAIRINNLLGGTLATVSTFPTGGIYELADQTIKILNSGATVIELGINYANDTNLSIADTTLEDSVGTILTLPTVRQIIIPNTVVNSASVTGELMTIVVPTAVSPSGICYENPQPAFNLSYTTGDSWNKFEGGAYDRTPPSYPVSSAQLDYSATQADVRVTPAMGTSGTDSVAPTMLKDNNKHGNKYVYTDDIGNPSDASVGSNLWAHVDWNGHSFAGATAGIIENHLTDYSYTQSYLLDGAKFNLTPTDGQSWADWITYVNGLGTYLGLSGWMPLDGSDMTGPHGAKCMPAIVWADNFFNLERSDNRGSFLTGENSTATLYYSFYDSGNNDMMVDVSKATSSGFQDVIVNIFLKRKNS
jgi:hypothetical protein